MPEIKSDENNCSAAPPPQVRFPSDPPAVDPNAPVQPHSGPPPAALDKTRHSSAPEVAKVTAAVPPVESVPAEKQPAAVEMKPLDLQLPKSPPLTRTNHTWIIILAALAFILVLVLLIPRSRQKAVTVEMPAASDAVKENTDLSNYSSFVAKNKTLMDDYSEQVLTDEPFAGQAPLAFAVNGPLVSADIDPQLAALADALRVRVQIKQGSQAIIRDNMVTRITKGDFRGFKVQAFEKLENGKVVSEETTIITPKNGMIKTVGRVLTMLQKTDPAALLSEISAAGMEYSPLPNLAGENNYRGQLRLPHYWGKPIPEDRLIFEESVGRVALGMPLVQLKSRIAVTDSVLKRKVLINDFYHDVYKVNDQKGDPLFFVYEKEGKVLGIWVVSEAFKTGKGIGVNSSLDQIRVYYPIVTLLRSEKKPPFVKVDGVAGMLIVQGEGNKKVVAILVGDSPEFN